MGYQERPKCYIARETKLFDILPALTLNNNNMSNIFVKYNMIQFINEPTHFTQNSSSCIELIQSTDPNVIDLIHFGQLFLSVHVRYHCPIYGLFKVPKTMQACFKIRIWLYDRGNYNQYREQLQRVDWDELILILEIVQMIYASHSQM